MTTARCTLFLCLAVPCGASVASAAQAQFIPLGHLPGGTTYIASRADAISADGSVVVGMSSVAGGTRAFRWTASGGMASLGELANGTFRSGAYGVNADGSVVVGYVVPLTHPDWVGFRWTAATGSVALPDFPGGRDYGYATDVTADGQVIAGIGMPDQAFEGLVWNGVGNPTGLGVPQGHMSAASGINADGSVVVGHVGTSVGAIAYVWSPAGAMPIDNFPGALQGNFATDVSDDGSVVVGWGHVSYNGHAFRWSASGGLVDLGGLWDVVTVSSAYAVSGDGRVIVGESYANVTGDRAFLWTESLGMVELQAYLGAHGATGLGGWRLLSARAVSYDGTSIAGYGYNPSGEIEAWLARIPPLSHSAGTSYCTPALPNSTGQPGRVRAPGSPFVGLDNLALRAEELPPGRFGYFLAGRTQGYSQPPGAQGFLCLAGEIGRYHRQVDLVQGPSGTIRVDLSAIPVSPPQSVLPGDTWNFQCWYRDSNPGPTSNFTDGVSVTFQ